MMRVFTGLLLSFGLLAGLAARAQGLDPTFAPTLMKGDYTIGVRALAVQPDGKVLVGGNYDFVGGALNNKVLRLNADGSRDGSFQPTGGANGQVSALAIQPDGKILIAGAFSGYDGTVTGPLARLNANGTLDTSFAAPSALGISGNVLSVAVQPDGKIVVGGYLLRVPECVARLNANGTLDASFNVGSGAAGIAVYAVLVQPDGKIVVGGDFTGFNGGSTGGVVRLNANGSTDTGFNVGGTGTAYVVASLALQPDGKLLAGGGFRTFNGTAMPRLVRLLPNGTLDTSFQTGTGPNTSLVARVRVLGSGQILIAGGFSAVNGQRLGSVMRLSATGSVDTSFGTAGGVGITGRCFDAVEWTGGQVLAGGSFTTYPTLTPTRAPIAYLVRLGSNGVVDQGFNLNLESRGMVSSAVPLTTGKLLVLGDFSSFNGAAVTNGGLHRLNANGSYDLEIVPAAPASPTAYYQQYYPQPDGRIYAILDEQGGTTDVYSVVRLLANGMLDGSFVSPTFENPGNYVSFTQVLPLANGTVVVVGDFETVNGSPRFQLARLQASGALDAGFNTTAFANGQSTVQTVAAEPGGTLLLNVYQNTGAVGSKVYRLDASGNRVAAFAVDGNFAVAGTPLYSSLVQPNGQILVWGNFTGYAGTATPNNLLRLNANGTLDAGFVAGLGGIVKAVQPDGRLLVKTNYGLPTSSLQRLNANGSVDTSFPAVVVTENSFYNSTWNLVLQPQDSKIILFGGFTSVAGQQRIGLARLNNTLLGTAGAAAEAAFTVFPNPAHGSATLALPAAPVARPLLLLDATGRVLRRQLLPAQATTAPLDLRGLPAGLYLVRCGGATQRLVVE